MKEEDRKLFIDAKRSNKEIQAKNLVNSIGDQTKGP